MMLSKQLPNYLQQIMKPNTGRGQLKFPKNDLQRSHKCMIAYKKPLMLASQSMKYCIEENKSIPITPINNNLAKYKNITKIMGESKSISIKTLSDSYLNYLEGISSRKAYNIVKGYGCNSFQGITDKINEDRITIEMQIKPPTTFVGLTWPKVHFFGIYDGHGGTGCSNFLKRNLHNYAIIKGFKIAENEFMKKSIQNESNLLLDESGSCALITLIVNEKVFVANLGDSRALISTDNGKKWKDVTIDHKPNEKNEKERILKNGGKIAENESNNKGKEMISTLIMPKLRNNNNQSNYSNIIYRVIPGGLAVSRTIGDIRSKLKQFGGLENVISPVPDIFIVNPIQADFLVLGSDGVFDTLQSSEAIRSAWEAITKIKDTSVHNQCLNCANIIIKSALANQSNDNVSCIIIAFDNFEKNLNKQNIKKKFFKRSNSLSESSILENGKNSNQCIEEYDYQKFQ